MYKCSKCGIYVIVLPNGEIIKPCNCNVSIIAEASSTLNGVGGFK